MAAELRVALEAEQDIADAYGWYERQRIGLGEEFLSRVDASIQNILRNPELHRVVYETYRRILVRRFPYAIFYD
jgi:plasmid stabilization system protein ParE